MTQNNKVHVSNYDQRQYIVKAAYFRHMRNLSSNFYITLLLPGLYIYIEFLMIMPCIYDYSSLITE